MLLTQTEPIKRSEPPKWAGGDFFHVMQKILHYKKGAVKFAENGYFPMFCGIIYT